MRKPSWRVATSVIVLAFGIGHAGCYTSGTPGGSGAGGSPPAGGGTSAGTANGGNTNGGDAGNGDSGAGACASNSDCTGCAAVCVVDAGQCVECLVDSDCKVGTSCAGGGGGGTGGAGGGTATGGATAAAADRYCLQNKCNDFVMCSERGVCSDKTSTCDVTAHHCVQCLSTADCTALNLTGTICAGNKCRPTCQSSNFQCTSSTGLCSVSDGTTGICTEHCSIDSDCYPGYECVDTICVPSG